MSPNSTVYEAIGGSDGSTRGIQGSNMQNDRKDGMGGKCLAASLTFRDCVSSISWREITLTVDCEGRPAPTLTSPAATERR